mgnify:CR=1 FL=1
MPVFFSIIWVDGINNIVEAQQKVALRYFEDVEKLQHAIIDAKFNGFDFDLPLYVTSFKINIPGKGVFTCDGDELSGQAKQALKGAKKGSSIIISSIEAKGRGTSTIIPQASPLIVTLKN